MKYKTYKTMNGFYIESPHDFAEIDISTVYTSSKSYYYNRVKDIIEKRLKKYDIASTAERFFPPNIKQEEAIETIKEQMRDAHAQGESRGSRKSDDPSRYARPVYMRSLAGKSKSSSTYSYAGFKSIVNISSGIIRNFLELASTMYTTQESKSQKTSSKSYISHQIQDLVIHSWSDRYIGEEFDRVSRDEPGDELLRLFNLIQSLGKFFRSRILDEKASERRLISIMVNQKLTTELESVLRKGVELGYLHTSTITDKEGLGRKRIFILNRRLTPYFKIDPSGYAAHLSVTQDDLEIACLNPEKFLQIRSRRTLNDNDEQQPLLIDTVSSKRIE